MNTKLKLVLLFLLFLLQKAWAMEENKSLVPLPPVVNFPTAQEIVKALNKKPKENESISRKVNKGRFTFLIKLKLSKEDAEDFPIDFPNGTEVRGLRILDKDALNKEARKYFRSQIVRNHEYKSMMDTYSITAPFLVSFTSGTIRYYNLEIVLHIKRDHPPRIMGSGIQQRGSIVPKPTRDVDFSPETSSMREFFYGIFSQIHKGLYYLAQYEIEVSDSRPESLSHLNFLLDLSVENVVQALMSCNNKESFEKYFLEDASRIAECLTFFYVAMAHIVENQRQFLVDHQYYVHEQANILTNFLYFLMMQDAEIRLTLAQLLALTYDDSCFSIFNEETNEIIDTKLFSKEYRRELCREVYTVFYFYSMKFSGYVLVGDKNVKCIIAAK